MIHAPAVLQGKPGQCPECGSKFHIPSYDEPQEDGGQDGALVVGGPPDSMHLGPPGGSSVIFGAPFPSDEPQAGIAPLGLEHVPPSRPAEGPVPPPLHTAPRQTPPQPAEAPESLFHLFGRLWGQTVAAAASIEIRFGQSQDLAPDRFSKEAVDRLPRRVRRG